MILLRRAKCNNFIEQNCKLVVIYTQTFIFKKEKKKEGGGGQCPSLPPSMMHLFDLFHNICTHGLFIEYMCVLDGILIEMIMEFHNSRSHFQWILVRSL